MSIINLLFKNKNKNKEKVAKDIAAIVIADTHGFAKEMSAHSWFEENPEYDVCLILGDCTEEDLAYICSHVDVTKAYGVYGNHDTDDLYEKYGIANIHGKVVEIKGKSFVGWERSVKYKPNIIGVTQEESLDFEKTLPPADYLVSHDGPFEPDNKNIVHQGLRGISRYQKRTGCYILRGHIHTRYEKENERCFYGIERCML